MKKKNTLPTVSGWYWFKGTCADMDFPDWTPTEFSREWGDARTASCCDIYKLSCFEGEWIKMEPPGSSLPMKEEKRLKKSLKQTKTTSLGSFAQYAEE